MPTKSPNILVVMSDQHNADGVNWLDTRVFTPNLDRLRQDGVNFTAAYCNNPLCVPSRLSFMSGMSTQTIEAWSLNDALRPAVATWPVKLRSLGYETVMSGRMHAIWGDRKLGFEKRLCGDGEFQLTSGPNRPNWDRPETPGFGPQGILSNIGVDGNYPRRTDDETALAKAVDYLHARSQSSRERPFALCVGFFQPHPPFVPPREFWELYKDSDVELEPFDESLPAFMRDHAVNRRYRETIPPENKRTAIRAYRAMISQVDAYAGRLLDTLQETGLYEDTLVVYTSDHGELLGHRGMWHKQCLLERSVKVPLIIKYPGKLSAGATVSTPVSLLDLYPTFAQLAGAEADCFLEGVSLADPGRVPEHEIFAEYADFGLQAPRAMLRQGRYKLIEARGYEPVLFDLDRDPDERKNLAETTDYRSILASLRSALRQRWNPDETFRKVLHNQKHVDVWAKACGLGGESPPAGRKPAAGPSD